jgi:hypothetical protein
LPKLNIGRWGWRFRRNTNISIGRGIAGGVDGYKKPPGSTENADLIKKNSDFIGGSFLDVVKNKFFPARKRRPIKKEEIILGRV